MHIIIRLIDKNYLHTRLFHLVHPIGGKEKIAGNPGDVGGDHRPNLALSDVSLQLLEAGAVQIEAAVSVVRINDYSINALLLRKLAQFFFLITQNGLIV